MVNWFRNRLLVSVLITFAVLACVPTKYSQVSKVNNLHRGQTAPPDMILIPGNETVDSFYIGIIEEPNINYVMYLKYLASVYISYPYIFYDALPKTDSILDQTTINGTNINEAYIVNSLTNPVAAYYPVTNLTWNQIQKYLLLKADRLNEQILLELNMAIIQDEWLYDDYQMNTEALLARQFKVVWLKPFENAVSTIDFLNANGILFDGMRLPTLNEWQRANDFSISTDLATRSPRL